MFYRVVMQGRTLGSADVAEVKYDFVRVTGLPAQVVEEFFGGMPRVIKRQVSQSDAERIASTLRAIGAAATIEREQAGGEEKEGSVVINATPFNGPPTIIPGSQAVAPAPSRRPRWMRNLRDHMPWLLGVGALIGVGVLAAPFIDDLVTNFRPGAASAMPSTAAPKKAAVAPAEAVQAVNTMSPRFLHGPWRCTDQRTGVANYWTYDADGSLVFHGDVLSDRPLPKSPPAGTPIAWKLDGARLSITSTERPVEVYTVAELSLSRLRYGNDAGLEIQCRRP